MLKIQDENSGGKANAAITSRREQFLSDLQYFFISEYPDHFPPKLGGSRKRKLNSSSESSSCHIPAAVVLPADMKNEIELPLSFSTTSTDAVLPPSTTRMAEEIVVAEAIMTDSMSTLSLYVKL